MDEKVLLKRAKQGDLSAFEALIRAYQNKIYALALRMTKNADDAFDVAQESVLKIYRALPSFRGDAAFSTWIYRISRNAALDFLRKKRTETSLDELREWGIELPGPIGSIEGDVLTAEKRRAVARMIAALPEQLRAAIILRDIDGYSYEEIAILTKTALGTVKSRLYRARAMVRNQLREFGEEDE